MRLILILFDRKNAHITRTLGYYPILFKSYSNSEQKFGPHSRNEPTDSKIDRT